MSNPSLDFTLQLPLHQRPPLQKPLQHLKLPPQLLPRRQLQAQQPLLQHLQLPLAEKFMLNHGFSFNFLKNWEISSNKNMETTPKVILCN